MKKIIVVLLIAIAAMVYMWYQTTKYVTPEDKLTKDLQQFNKDLDKSNDSIKNVKRR